MKQYWYWIVYLTENGEGGIDLSINNPITTGKQVKDIAVFIKNKYNFTSDILVTNFIFLREESDEQNEH